MSLTRTTTIISANQTTTGKCRVGISEVAVGEANEWYLGYFAVYIKHTASSNSKLSRETYGCKIPLVYNMGLLFNTAFYIVVMTFGVVYEDGATLRRTMSAFALAYARTVRYCFPLSLFASYNCSTKIHSLLPEVRQILLNQRFSKPKISKVHSPNSIGHLKLRY